MFYQPTKRSCFFVGKKKRTGPNCCATFCKSRRGEDKIGFFRVLRKKDPVRTKKWAQKINRQNPDGTLWMPSQYSLICAKHFVSGRPSNDSANPDFLPSIFASHGNPKSLNDLERFERAKKRLDEKDKVI